MNLRCYVYIEVHIDVAICCIVSRSYIRPLYYILIVTLIEPFKDLIEPFKDPFKGNPILVIKAPIFLSIRVLTSGAQAQRAGGDLRCRSFRQCIAFQVEI